MPVLVTGAGGFLGGELVKELLGVGLQVRALVRSRSQALSGPAEIAVGDIRDAGCMRTATSGCSAVVHLAGKAHAMEDDDTAVEEYRSVNVEGTKRLLECCVNSGVRTFIFISSVKVFGETTAGCIDEQAPPAPQSPYAQSKWAAEQLVASYAKVGSLATVSLRLPLVYGATHKGNLYRMIEAIDHGRFPPLPRLRTVRSMLHVRNFVSAVRTALTRSSFRLPAYIVADNRPYSTTHLYDQLRKELGLPPPSCRVPLWALEAAARCGDGLQTLTGKRMPLSSSLLSKLTGEAWYSPSAFMKDFAYQPAVTFDMAVSELVRYYRGHSSRCGC
ncbi:MAG TPA: NAD-dependent epimerase/dehydratase family protein [Nitrospira sp.]|nr:NAD-dependent epimerase/dehydratase family protein [Nitrospira sp.]